MATQPSNPMQSTAPPLIPVQRKSWLGRNWIWLLVVMFVCGVVLVLGIFTLIMGAMRSSDVVKEGVARAQSNPLVVQRLGTPISQGWLVSGSINVSTGSGNADVAVPISGPKGNGTVYVTGQKIAGIWTYSVIQAAIEGSGERIDLLSGARPAEPQSSTPSPAPSATANLQNRAAQNSADAVAATAPQPNAPAPNSSAAVSSDIIQSQDTNTPGVVGELIQCRRSDGVLSVKIRFHNTTGTAVNFYVLGTNISYDRFYLAAASKKYFILKDSAGTELAPGGDYSCGMPGVCEKLPAGQSNTWWAKFPAPSADVTKLDLFTPVTPPFEGIPITGN
jgi:Cytochrome oxidase complex assembly protein 1